MTTDVELFERFHEGIKMAAAAAKLLAMSHSNENYMTLAHTLEQLEEKARMSAKVARMKVLT